MSVVISTISVSFVAGTGGLATATPLKAIVKVRAIAIATTLISSIVLFIFFLFHLLKLFFYKETFTKETYIFPSSLMVI